MKKSIAIVLIVIAVVLCACPGLLFGGGSFYASSSPELMATSMAKGQEALGVAPSQSEMGPAITQIRILAGCTICLGLAIPLVVALITLRMARNKSAQNPAPQ